MSSSEPVVSSPPQAASAAKGFAALGLKPVKITTKSQLKQLQASSRRPNKSLKPRSTNPQRDSVPWTSYSSGTQRWLAEMKPQLLPSNDPRWTQSCDPSVQVTTSYFDSASDVKIFTVGSLTVAFNNEIDNTFFGGSTNTSTLQITSNDLGNEFMSVFGALDTLFGGEGPFPNLSPDVIAANTGYFYAVDGVDNTEFFDSVAIVPLELDKNGVATTFRLDITRAYEAGSTLAVQVLVVTTQYELYRETSFAILQSSEEVSYTVGGETNCNVWLATPFPSSSWGDPTSSSSVESFYAGGGVVSALDGYWETAPVTIFGAQASTDGDLPDLNGVTLTMRFPNALITQPLTPEAAPERIEECRHTVFGLDMYTMLFLLLFVVVVILTVSYVFTMGMGSSLYGASAAKSPSSLL